MIYKNLYIIGNGFDLHHGIQCNYKNFMEWIKKNDPVFFLKLTQVYDDASKCHWWSDFENSLAKLNIINYAYLIGDSYDPEYVSDGSIDNRTGFAAQKVIEEFKSIKESLRNDFQKWLLEAYEN